MRAFSIFDPFSSQSRDPSELKDTVRSLRKITTPESSAGVADDQETERMISNLLVVQHLLQPQANRNALEMLEWLDAPDLYITPSVIASGSSMLLNVSLATIIQPNNTNEDSLIHLISMLMSGDGIHDRVFIDLALFKEISEKLSLKLLEYEEWAMSHGDSIYLLWVHEHALPEIHRQRLTLRFRLRTKGGFLISEPISK